MFKKKARPVSKIGDIDFIFGKGFETDFYKRYEASIKHGTITEIEAIEEEVKTVVGGLSGGSIITKEAIASLYKSLLAFVFVGLCDKEKNIGSVSRFIAMGNDFEYAYADSLVSDSMKNSIYYYGEYNMDLFISLSRDFRSGTNYDISAELYVTLLSVLTSCYGFDVTGGCSQALKELRDNVTAIEHEEHREQLRGDNPIAIAKMAVAAGNNLVAAREGILNVNDGEETADDTLDKFVLDSDITESIIDDDFSDLSSMIGELSGFVSEVNTESSCFAESKPTECREDK